MWANKKNSFGFTIVETLIVLAVTSALFVSTSLLVSGQISRQQYKNGMNQTQTVIKSSINEVQTGYFPDISVLTTVNCGGVDYSISSSGLSDNCILVGKRLTFDATDFKIDTLVDAKTATGPSAATSVVSGIQQTVPYPNNMQLSTATPGPVTINVVYATYPNTISGNVGTFGVEQRASNWALINNGNTKKICFTDGARKGSVTFGVNNSFVPTVLVQDSTC